MLVWWVFSARKIFRFFSNADIRWRIFMVHFPAICVVFGLPEGIPQLHEIMSIIACVCEYHSMCMLTIGTKFCRRISYTTPLFSSHDLSGIFGCFSNSRKRRNQHIGQCRWKNIPLYKYILLHHAMSIHESNKLALGEIIPHLWNKKQPFRERRNMLV